MNRAVKFILAGFFGVLFFGGLILCSGKCFSGNDLDDCGNGFLAKISSSCPFRSSVNLQSSSIRPEINSFSFVPNKEIIIYSRNLSSLDIFAKASGKERLWGHATLKSSSSGLQKWSFDFSGFNILAEEVWAEGRSIGTKDKTISMSLPFSGVVPIFQSLYAEEDRAVFQENFGKSQKLFSGETLISENGIASVTFLEVLGDSRCPIGVNCFWAGKVAAKFIINSNLELPQNVILSLEPGKEAAAVYLGKNFKLKLISVGPQKIVETQIPKLSYYVVVSFEKD